MASTIKVDKLDPQSGTALEIGTSGDTVTVPSGVGLTLTDSTLLLPTTITSTTEVKTNKISPATGTAFALGDSGDTFTIPSGATITNSGTATGFGGGKLLQVLQDTLTGTFSTTSLSFTDITGLTIDITPAASSSKILVMAQMSSWVANGYALFFSLVRDSTEIFIGDADGSRARISSGSVSSMGINRTQDSSSIIYLDSPSSTSALTYKIQMRISESGTTGYINYTTNDTDNSGYPRATCSITVMEIGA